MSDINIMNNAEGPPPLATRDQLSIDSVEREGGVDETTVPQSEGKE